MFVIVFDFCDVGDFCDLWDFPENRGERLWALGVFKKTHFFQNAKLVDKWISRFWLCTNYVKHMQNTSAFSYCQIVIVIVCDFWDCLCVLFLEFVLWCVWWFLWFSGKSRWALVNTAFSNNKNALFSKCKMGGQMDIKLLTLYRLRKTYVKH